MIDRGYQLTMTGIDVKPFDDGDVRAFMRDLIRITGLTPFYGPEVTETESGCYAGFAMIAESHIAVHAVDQEPHRLVFLDVFSCRAFPVFEIEDAAREAWGGRWRKHVMIRKAGPE